MFVHNLTPKINVTENLYLGISSFCRPPLSRLAVTPVKLSTVASWVFLVVAARFCARRSWWRLRSASSTSLVVRHTRLSTVGDSIYCCNHSFVVQWSSLLSHVTAAPSLSIFCCRLKSHLFSLSLSDSSLCAVPARWLVIIDTVIYKLYKL